MTSAGQNRKKGTELGCSDWDSNPMQILAPLGFPCFESHPCALRSLRSLQCSDWDSNPGHCRERVYFASLVIPRSLNYPSAETMVFDRVGDTMGWRLKATQLIALAGHPTYPNDLRLD